MPRKRRKPSFIKYCSCHGSEPLDVPASVIEDPVAHLCEVCLEKHSNIYCDTCVDKREMSPEDVAKMDIEYKINILDKHLNYLDDKILKINDILSQILIDFEKVKTENKYTIDFPEEDDPTKVKEHFEKVLTKLKKDTSLIREVIQTVFSPEFKREITLCHTLTKMLNIRECKPPLFNKVKETCKGIFVSEIWSVVASYF